MTLLEMSECYAESAALLSAVLQKATMIAPPDPIAEWREVALRQCRGPFGGWLRRLIERELPRDEAAYRPERLGVIHGDFHHGNFLFVDGRVAATTSRASPSAISRGSRASSPAASGRPCSGACGAWRGACGINY